MSRGKPNNISCWRSILLTAACFVYLQSARAQYGEDSSSGTFYDTTAITIVEEDHDFIQKQGQTEPLAVHQRQVPDSVVSDLQEDDNFWYANSVIKKEEPPPQKTYTPVTQQTWFQVLVWLVIIGGFAAFLVIFLPDNNVSLFRRKNVLLTEPDEELVTENIFAINHEKEIDKATAQENYRLAVRLMFLRLLKNISDRNIIRYQQDKTNFEYLTQLQSTRYYRDFFRITRDYEYSWYGKFDVSKDMYAAIRNDFVQLERSFA